MSVLDTAQLGDVAAHPHGVGGLEQDFVFGQPNEPLTVVVLAGSADHVGDHVIARQPRIPLDDAQVEIGLTVAQRESDEAVLQAPPYQSNVEFRQHHVNHVSRCKPQQR